MFCLYTTSGIKFSDGHGFLERKGEVMEKSFCSCGGQIIVGYTDNICTSCNTEYWATWCSMCDAEPYDPCEEGCPNFLKEEK